MIERILPNSPPTRDMNARVFLVVTDGDGNDLKLLPLVGGPLPAAPASMLDTQARWLTDSAPVQMLGQGLLEDSLLPLVEDGLKRIWDFGYLGNHALTRLRLVQSRYKTTGEPLTSLDRGKTVSALLSEMIEKLRPDGPLPGRNAIPHREWHPYLILQRAYIEGDRNYEIMNCLYVSEGTFHRARRRALQAVSTALAELERQM